jgi:glycerol-3-phosphate dehydrogenase
MDMLEPLLAPSRPGAWTATAPLPGGDIPDFAAFLADCRSRYAFLPDAVLIRLAHAYGSRLPAVLGEATSLAGLGEDFGAGLYAAELRYLRANEWARTGEDVLWRRSKLGLRLDPAQQARVAAAMEAA